jgi:hypothetical protein
MRHDPNSPKIDDQLMEILRRKLEKEARRNPDICRIKIQALSTDEEDYRAAGKGLSRK